MNMHKILIVSDSHRLTEELDIIKERHDVNHRIHCGDSELLNNHPTIQSFTTVEGNCDSPGEFKVEEQLSVDHLNIFITHGHLYRVKTNLLPLTYRAAEVNANIVCFGHSHIAGAEKIDECIYINPGSIRSPRRLKEKSYVLLSWKDHSEIQVNYYNLKGELISDLSTTFSLPLKSDISKRKS